MCLSQAWFVSEVALGKKAKTALGKHADGRSSQVVRTCIRSHICERAVFVVPELIAFILGMLLIHKGMHVIAVSCMKCICVP